MIFSVQFSAQTDSIILLVFNYSLHTKQGIKVEMWIKKSMVEHFTKGTSYRYFTFSIWFSYAFQFALTCKSMDLFLSYSECMTMMNCFWGMVNRRTDPLSAVFTIGNILQTASRIWTWAPVQHPSWSLLNEVCAFVITITPQSHFVAKKPLANVLKILV